MTVLTGKVITSSSEVKLTGITIDYELKFQKHDINTGVPQGAMLGLLLFNVFINDLFFSIKSSEVCNFADDHTLFCGDKNLGLAFPNLSSDLINVMDWFKINFFKANSAKFQFMVLGANKKDCFNLNVFGKVIPSSSEVKFFETTTDYELKLKKHINELCRKASYKLYALQRIRRYLSVDHARLFANVDQGLRMRKTIPCSCNVVFLPMGQVLKSHQISQSLIDMDVEWSERLRFCQIILFKEFFSFI